jgi:hypothetical protein
VTFTGLPKAGAVLEQNTSRTAIRIPGGLFIVPPDMRLRPSPKMIRPAENRCQTRQMTPKAVPSVALLKPENQINK